MEFLAVVEGLASPYHTAPFVGLDQYAGSSAFDTPLLTAAASCLVLVVV